MKRSKPKKYRVDLGYFLLIVAFILLFLSTRSFYMGFHNRDLVYNYQNLALQLNPHLQEANLTLVGVDEAMDDIMGKNEDLSLSELYSIGVSQEVIGFTLMFFTGIIFIWGILTIKFEKH